MIEEECSVCCHSLKERPVIQCKECGYSTCRFCVETYFTTITSDAHCMNCRCLWDILFLRKNLTLAFWEGVFQQRRKEILQHRSRRRECFQTPTIGVCPSCPFGKILKSTMSCSSCWIKFCKDCGSSITETTTHVCLPESVLCIQKIQQTTKPCPCCHVPIEKQSGCFQMFCTHCYTAFDWKNHVLLPKNKHLHNPHYFEHCFQPQQLSFLIEKKLKDLMTNIHLQRKCKEFYYLFLEIKKQWEYYSRPYSCSVGDDLYEQDLLQQQYQCQSRIWASFYQRAFQLLQKFLSTDKDLLMVVVNAIQSFQQDLQETLLDYNEHVAECLQLRGYRLFPCNAI